MQLNHLSKVDLDGHLADLLALERIEGIGSVNHVHEVDKRTCLLSQQSYGLDLSKVRELFVQLFLCDIRTDVANPQRSGRILTEVVLNVFLRLDDGQICSTSMLTLPMDPALLKLMTMYWLPMMIPCRAAFALTALSSSSKLTKAQNL